MKKLSKTNKQRIDDPGKDVAQRQHFIKRVKERLLINITDELYDHIVACIKNDKVSDLFTLKHLYDQSNRLMVWEITFKNTVPANIVYDKKRKTIITLLLQKEDEEQEINYYYDVFNNKVMLYHDLGYTQKWALKDDTLIIPSETVEFGPGYWEVTSDGILKGKRFKYDNNLYEVIN